MPTDNLDSQNLWNDVNNTTGNSKYLKRHAFSPLVEWDNVDLTAVQFIPCNLEQIDHPPVKVRFFRLLCCTNLIVNVGGTKSGPACVVEWLELSSGLVPGMGCWSLDKPY